MPTLKNLLKLLLLALLARTVFACGGTASPEVNLAVVKVLKEFLAAARHAFADKDLASLSAYVNENGTAFLREEWEADWREGAVQRTEQALRIWNIDQFGTETAVVEFGITYSFHYEDGHQESFPMQQKLFFRWDNSSWVIDGGYTRLR